MAKISSMRVWEGIGKWGEMRLGDINGSKMLEGLI